MKKYVVTIGRFNPPTKGHYSMLTAMRSYVASHKDLGLEFQLVVVVIDGAETSKDLARNPLTPQERIKFMQRSGHANDVKFVVASNAVDAFKKCRELSLEPVAIAAGQDRAADYLRILDSYFGTDDTGQPIKHVKLEFKRNESADADGSDIKSISASAARAAVIEDDLEKFTALAALEHNSSLAAQMYKLLKQRMSAKE